MRGQPFTATCRQLADLVRPSVADLHAHTTASDGDYTPSQIVALAKQKRLSAVAISDHDTLAGVPDAIEAGRSLGVRVVPAVEVSTELDGREFHLLAYHVPLDSPLINRWFAEVCERRRERFDCFVAELAKDAIAFEPWRIEQIKARSVSLGRRHVAGLLMNSGLSKTRFEAFRSYILPLKDRVPKSHLTPIAETFAKLNEVGAVASLAHPSEGIDRETIGRLKRLGLQALEVNFPASTKSRTVELRKFAQEFDLAVTGGSDCHGPEPASRTVGTFGISATEFDALNRLVGPSG